MTKFIHFKYMENCKIDIKDDNLYSITYTCNVNISINYELKNLKIECIK